jgi:CheY-like chemotaxis protein
MVVDDEEDLLAVTKKMLEINGYSVHAFDNPIKGLEHVENEDCKECSIVVSDVRMPGMTGLELVMRLKKIRPEMRIVLMTAFKIHRHDLQNIIPSTEVDAFLGKPFRIADLIEAIKDDCGTDV